MPSKVLQGKILKTVFLTSIIAMPAYKANASSYQQVYDVVFNQANIADTDDEKIQAEKSVYLANELPLYKVSAAQFNQRVTQRLANRTKQTLIDKDDYYERLDKLVHSNGICMAGKWYITEEPKNANNQSYTGMFAKGAESAFIGRLSVALSETRQGQRQGFGLAGKIFGTQDVNQSVISENFFVADVLAGAYRDSVFSAPMTNKPKVGFRFSVLGLGLKIAPLFKQADNNAGMRPVSGLANMGMDDAETVIAPKFMMVVPNMPNGYEIQDNIDFRDEFALTDEEVANGVSRQFSIYVSDVASNPEDEGWQHIGFIQANETVVSYGCDRQLHFAHPKSDTAN